MPLRRRPEWHIVIAALLLASLACAAMTVWARRRAAEANAARLTVKALRPAADQFAAAAESCVEQGDWADALQQFQYALILVPEQAEWRCRLGDLWMSQFDFERAIAAYRHAAEGDARLAAAWDSMEVCERLIRARETPNAPSENALYAVHRTMMKHGRLAEAVRVAAKLTNDPDAQRETWQERLRKGGLDADVGLDRSRRLTVRLRGPVQAHLGLLHGIPAVAVWMPETDVTDLQPLAGLALEELDVSRTMVSKLDPL